MTAMNASFSVAVLSVLLATSALADDSGIAANETGAAGQPGAANNSGLKAAFLGGTAPVDSSEGAAADVAFLQQNAGFFKGGQMSPGALIDYRNRFHRVADALGVSPGTPEYQSAAALYMTGPSSPMPPPQQKQAPENGDNRDAALIAQNKSINVGGAVKVMNGSNAFNTTVVPGDDAVNPSAANNTSMAAVIKAQNVVPKPGPQTVRNGFVPDSYSDVLSEDATKTGQNTQAIGSGTVSPPATPPISIPPSNTPQAREALPPIDLAGACQKMMRACGDSGAAETYLSKARDGKVDLKTRREALANLSRITGVQFEDPTYDQGRGDPRLRDLEHYLTSFDMSKVKGMLAPESDDGAVATSAKFAGREVGALGMSIMTIGYSGLKAGVQAVDLKNGYFNGPDTSRASWSEVTSGLSGAWDSVGDLGVHDTPKGTDAMAQLNCRLDVAGQKGGVGSAR